MINIVQRRKIWFGFSLVLILASVFVLATWNLKLGIDFTGGTLMEFSFKEKTLNSEEIKESLKDFDLGEISVQFSGEKNVLLRFKDVSEDTHQEIITILNSKIAGDNLNISSEAGLEEIVLESDNEKNTILEEAGNESDNEEVLVENTEVNTPVLVSTENNIEEKRFDSIGPVVGNELKSTAVIAIIIALIAIILYIGWAFRRVSRPVSSFKYGIIATITLFHDIIITLGVFSVLGYLYNVEVGISFIAALLAILGYSVNDTIVVFDRTRENLIKFGNDDFEKVVNKSVNETLIRSLNTSFTTLLVLATLYLFGGASIKYFIVALLVGISVGTYSSIFIASPLLVTWQKWSLRMKK